VTKASNSDFEVGQDGRLAFQVSGGESNPMHSMQCIAVGVCAQSQAANRASKISLNPDLAAYMRRRAIFLYQI